MEITRLENNDHLLSGRLWEQFYSEAGHTWQVEELHFKIVEEKDIGYMHLLVISGVMRIEQIVIEKQHRKKGYGKKALNFIENLAKEKGCHKMRLETCPKIHKRAVDVYRKFGFEEEASLDDDILDKTWVILSKYI